MDKTLEKFGEGGKKEKDNDEAEKENVQIDEKEIVCIEDASEKPVMVTIPLYVAGQHQMYTVPLTNFSNIPMQQSSDGNMEIELDEEVCGKMENILEEERIQRTDFIGDKGAANESMDFEEILWHWQSRDVQCKAQKNCKSGKVVS